MSHQQPLHRRTFLKGVDCAVGAAPCLTVADTSGYVIDEAEVIYWGTCPKCLSANRGSPGD